MASRVDFIIEKDKISGLPQAVQAALAKLVASTAAKIEITAKENAPVLSGFLRDSISHEIDGSNGLAATIYVGADYGMDVEMGTIKRAPHPFLTPAVEAEKSAFLAGIGDSIKEAAR